MHTIIETSAFEKKAQKLLSTAEYETLVLTLATTPDVGDVIQGTGGFRKLGLAREAAGKSGGYRVVYFFHYEGCPVYLFDVYGKNERSDLTDEQKNVLARLAVKLKTH